MITGLIALMAAAAAASSGSPQPAPAPAAAPAAASAAPADTDSGDKVICRVMTPTGSRLGGTRVCRTQRQWSVINRDAKDLVNDATTGADHYTPQRGG